MAAAYANVTMLAMYATTAINMMIDVTSDGVVQRYLEAWLEVS